MSPSAASAHDRRPAVAGLFYPRDAAEMRRGAQDLLQPASPESVPEPATAVLCPHAGWLYAGALAGRILAATVIPSRVVLLGPNHTGRGARQAIWAQGQWHLPGFDLPVDAAFSAAWMKLAPNLVFDVDAHEHEHAIEVLLPLLKARQPQLHVVPVVLGRLDLGACLALGEALALAIRAQKDPTLIVISSDLSHELPDAAARELDRLAISEMEAVSPAGLYDAVRAHGISMCGVVPATVGLAACRALGATAAELIGHSTSGDVSGDRTRVVGYAALRWAERFVP
jgi:AmmeMemoRadiSam system protein B